MIGKDEVKEYIPKTSLSLSFSSIVGERVWISSKSYKPKSRSDWSSYGGAWEAECDDPERILLDEETSELIRESEGCWLSSDEFKFCIEDIQKIL